MGLDRTGCSGQINAKDDTWLLESRVAKSIEAMVEETE